MASKRQRTLSDSLPEASDSVGCAVVGYVALAEGRMSDSVSVEALAAAPVVAALGADLGDAAGLFADSISAGLPLALRLARSMFWLEDATDGEAWADATLDAFGPRSDGRLPLSEAMGMADSFVGQAGGAAVQPILLAVSDGGRAARQAAALADSLAGMSDSAPFASLAYGLAAGNKTPDAADAVVRLRS